MFNGIDGNCFSCQLCLFVPHKRTNAQAHVVIIHGRIAVKIAPSNNECSSAMALSCLPMRRASTVQPLILIEIENKQWPNMQTDSTSEHYVAFECCCCGCGLRSSICKTGKCSRALWTLRALFGIHGVTGRAKRSDADKN